MFGVSLLAGFLMMAHVSVDVIARTLFRHPLPGTGEITASYYMIMVAFLPWAYVTINDSHITADLFTQKLPKHIQHVLILVIDLLTSGYLSLFIWQSVLSAKKRTLSGEVWEIPGGYLPVWPVRWVLTAAGISMIAVLVLRFVARLTGKTKYLEPKV